MAAAVGVGWIFAVHCCLSQIIGLSSPTQDLAPEAQLVRRILSMRTGGLGSLRRQRRPRIAQGRPGTRTSHVRSAIGTPRRLGMSRVWCSAGSPMGRIIAVTTDNYRFLRPGPMPLKAGTMN